MRYVIVSDIHGNYDALQAVDQVVKRWRKKGDKGLAYWFLGDILGYGPEPIECLKWLHYADIGQRWVAGNHDVEVLRLATSGGGGGASGQAKHSWQRHLEILRRPENSRWWEWFQKEVKESIDNEARSMVVEKHGDLACVFAHGSVNGTVVRRVQYLYPWGRYEDLLEIALLRLWKQHRKEQRTTCFFHGHTHYPIVAQLNTDGYGVTFHSIPYGEPIQLGDGCFGINPGSVGQPRDGDPRASFAILDTEARTITFHRVMYNVNNTVEKLEKGNYPQSLIELVSTANGGANLSHYRTVYRAPELYHLPVVGG